MIKSFVAVFVFLFISVFCFAQDFEVAPSKLNFDCEPGQIQTQIITINNHSNQKLQFNLDIADIQTDSLGRASAKIDLEHSCKNWMTLNPSFFDLNPNASAEVKVVMQVPPGQSQTTWAIIYVTPTEEQTSIAADKPLKTGIKVRPRIGIRVVQSPKSNTNYKGMISDLKETTQPKDSLRTFEVKISNIGDKLLEAKIYLVLSDLTTAKEIKAKPVRVSILPGNKHVAKLILPKNVPPGKYSLAAILDYGNNSNLEAVQTTIEVK